MVRLLGEWPKDYTTSYGFLNGHRYEHNKSKSSKGSLKNLRVDA